MPTTKILTIHFDGSCEPINPNGNMGIGVVATLNKEIIHKHSDFIKKGERGFHTTTNNIAEYLAVKYALEWCIEQGYKNVLFCGDSKLVVQQLKGEWAIKSGAYKDTALVCKKLLEHFSFTEFKWIPREQNTVADFLSKQKSV